MNLKIHACVGGTAVRDDIRTLQDGVHIVVGTPGRVYDMIQRRALRLESVLLFGESHLHHKDVVRHVDFCGQCAVTHPP